MPVPGYPVYYAPGLVSNYFFNDGMYWVYQDDNRYASSWHNGPWGTNARDAGGTGSDLDLERVRRRLVDRLITAVAMLRSPQACPVARLIRVR